MIDKLLKAAMQAPGSRMNKEPWEFIVIKNKETINKLSEMDHNSKVLKGANLAIVLIANMKILISNMYGNKIWQLQLQHYF